MINSLRLKGIAIGALIPTLNTPPRIAAASFILSEIITGGLLWLIYGRLSVSALIIAGVCSVVAPLLLSSRMIRQQQTIQEKNRQLERLADQFRRANAQLVEQNAQLDAFSYTVAHDLQNPLNAITGLSRLVEENYATSSPEMIREHLHMIDHAAHKMNRIVDDMLLLSQVKETQALKLEPLNMALIISEAVATVGHTIDDYGAELIIHQRWPQAIGYAPWVEQVWINYLSNALKYGGRPPKISVGARVTGRAIRFWVRDNGPGLTAEQQKAIFVPFQRLDQQMLNGHGVGLSIVRNIVERLGGEVGVESNAVPDGGSCFYFTLPRAAESTVPKRSIARTSHKTNPSSRRAQTQSRKGSSLSRRNREKDLAAP